MLSAREEEERISSPIETVICEGGGFSGGSGRVGKVGKGQGGKVNKGRGEGRGRGKEEGRKG